MKFSISYPSQGTTKSFNIDDDNKCRVFYERRMGHEVEADMLGEQFKGYVFKIAGGFDEDGFAMKQGVFSNGRLKLLLSPGTKGYRATRKGERKRKSVRGCIVGPDIKMLSLILIKKGDSQLPGLTDTIAPRRLGPKRAAGIRKLFGIQKKEGEKTSNTNALICKNVPRRTFKSKANAEKERIKAPKVQRLITHVRLRRKKVVKDTKIAKWRATLKATEEYQKLYDDWIVKKKAALHEAKKAEKVEKAKEEPKPAKKAEKPKVEKKEAKDAKKPAQTKDKKPQTKPAKDAKDKKPAKK